MSHSHRICSVAVSYGLYTPVGERGVAATESDAAVGTLHGAITDTGATGAGAGTDIIGSDDAGRGRYGDGIICCILIPVCLHGTAVASGRGMCGGGVDVGGELRCSLPVGTAVSIGNSAGMGDVVGAPGEHSSTAVVERGRLGA